MKKMKKLLDVGDIVKINKSFLDEPVGVLGYIYEVYDIGYERGVSVITQNGVDLGGFSSDEQDVYLEFVKESGSTFEFRNVIQMDRDFETEIKPLFNQ